MPGPRGPWASFAPRPRRVGVIRSPSVNVTTGFVAYSDALIADQSGLIVQANREGGGGFTLSV